MGIGTYLLLQLGVSIAGGFCIASFAFRRVWKNKVTQLKLIGFTMTFIIGFMLVGTCIGWLIDHNMTITR